MDVAELSMTQKNVLIDKLAVIIEEARIIMNEDNEESISDENVSRRIILLICMYLKFRESSIVEDEYRLLVLEDLMKILGNAWTEEFLDCKNHNQIKIKRTIENLSRICDIDNWR